MQRGGEREDKEEEENKSAHAKPPTPQSCSLYPSFQSAEFLPCTFISCLTDFVYYDYLLVVMSKQFSNEVLGEPKKLQYIIALINIIQLC